MKKIIFLGWLVVFLPAMLFAQEKIEAPVWNVGDKWVFDREGPIEVIGCDAQWYSVRFSGGIFPKDASGIAVFERSTLNVKYMLEKDQRKEYRGFRKKILNFPLTLGKQWKDLYQRDELAASGMVAMISAEYRETFRVLGWEEVEFPEANSRPSSWNIKSNLPCVAHWAGAPGMNPRLGTGIHQK
jgi:hypothetical protein